MEHDLIVGVDFGMSGTGVAYFKRGQVGGPEVFIDWPDSPKDEDEEKVPTVLVYDSENDSKVVAWGFNAQGHHASAVKYVEWFKTKLGEVGAPQHDVGKFIRDYFGCVYATLEDKLPALTLGGAPWQSARVKFVFSIPSTWQSTTVDTFKRLLCEAGFSQHTNHYLEVTLQEPHAVAVHELKHGSPSLFGGDSDPSKENKPILFVDAGSGTTDLCVVRSVPTTKPGSPILESLIPKTGMGIGSAAIDIGFEELMLARLEPVKGNLECTTQEAAHRLRSSLEFRISKHSFGNADETEFLMEIPGFKGPAAYDFPYLRNGSMLVDRDDIKTLFDRQIEKLIELICRVYSTFHDLELITVEDIVLSGGLVNSAYVQLKLRELLADALRVQVRLHVSKEPRLAVCQGLVYYALQGGIFPNHFAGCSFGVVCRVRKPRSLEAEPPAFWAKMKGKFRSPESKVKRENDSFLGRWGPTLNEARTTSRDTVVDHLKHVWIDDCVDWFLSRGQEVPTNEPVAHKFSTTFSVDVPEKDRFVYVRIVESSSSTPPLFGKGPGLELKTLLKVDLSSTLAYDIEERDTDLYNRVRRKKPYVKIEFVVEAEIGLAEAKLRCMDTKKTKVLSQVIDTTNATALQEASKQASQIHVTD